MNLHLAEIATQIAPGSTRGASRRSGRLASASGRLVMPPNITLIPLPAKCPELNSAGKRLAVSARQLALKPNLFKSFDDVVNQCCEAWNKLVDQPWRIISIGLRNWAHGSRSTSLGIRGSNPLSSTRKSAPTDMTSYAAGGTAISLDE